MGRCRGPRACCACWHAGQRGGDGQGGRGSWCCKQCAWRVASGWAVAALAAALACRSPTASQEAPSPSAAPTPTASPAPTTASPAPTASSPAAAPSSTPTQAPSTAPSAMGTSGPPAAAVAAAVAPPWLLAAQRCTLRHGQPQRHAASLGEPSGRRGRQHARRQPQLGAAHADGGVAARPRQPAAVVGLAHSHYSWQPDRCSE